MSRLFAMALPVLWILTGNATAGEIIGPARVVDGDTLEIGGQRVRLFGIDAPESKQPCRLSGEPWDCGQAAKTALADMIGRHSVRCDPRDVDRYKRIVAVCFAASMNLNNEMVRQGWAIAYRTYSKDFIPAEAEAQRARSGIWRGSFAKPWDWRRSNRGG